MRFALGGGFAGIAMAFAVGNWILNLSVEEIALTVVVSIVAGFFTLLLTLGSERNAWAKKSLLRGSLRTWIFFVLFYFVAMLFFAPPVRSLRAFAWMFVPLMFCNGFSVLAFGPVQDRLIARHQRKSR
ncbi:MAG: hypothetical protein HYW49_11590 [Deltaproteobacteria bacterium]|nr:hypothetical protein [Deltaproteobacteria bacterium]